MDMIKLLVVPFVASFAVASFAAASPAPARVEKSATSRESRLTAAMSGLSAPCLEHTQDQTVSFAVLRDGLQIVKHDWTFNGADKDEIEGCLVALETLRLNGFVILTKTSASQELVLVDLDTPANAPVIVDAAAQLEAAKAAYREASYAHLRQAIERLKQQPLP